MKMFMDSCENVGDGKNIKSFFKNVFIKMEEIIIFIGWKKIKNIS